MSIYNFKINGEKNLLSCSKENLSFSFLSTKAKKSYLFQILDEKEKLIHQENISSKDISLFYASFPFEEYHTYLFKVDNEPVGKVLVESTRNLHFIYAKNIENPTFIRKFRVEKKIKSALLAVTGVGLYASFINDQKVGDLYLTPGFNDYDAYLRYQIYDITHYLNEDNELRIVTGDGWYQGRIGFDNHPGKVWGDHHEVAFEIELCYEDDTKEKIVSDLNTVATDSHLAFSSIYDGEIIDFNRPTRNNNPVFASEKSFHLINQDGAFVKKILELDYRVIKTPKGEIVLDFGQNISGFVSFDVCGKKNDTVHLQYGEVLQDGNFYRDNLRTAKSELFVKCDGHSHHVEERFTYHGFRYVKVEGIEDLAKANFKAVVLSSLTETNVSFQSNSDYLNQLVKNTLWGARDNFVDIPTDCPQRDERMGWTADTQVFAKTACYFGSAYSFYKKFMKDLRVDQTRYYHGNIPAYTPSLKGDAAVGGAVWSDCASILPMVVYNCYGDKKVLLDSLPLMKDYADALIRHDEEMGNIHLVKDGFTFGDWLAQDGLTPQSMKGGTDDNYIQTVYYYVTLDLVYQALSILNKKSEAESYFTKKEMVKQALLDEYFTPNGRLSIDTQTAYILSLHFGLYRNKEAILDGFNKRLVKDSYQLKTGFTGTPLFLPTLFDNHMDEIAYRILFNKNCPGWYYQIALGATTIWERWNSLLPDGKISGTDMNSLNHYANGTVCQAIFEYVAGLRSLEPGFKSVIIEPRLDYRLKDVEYSYHSPMGPIVIKYHIKENNLFEFSAMIPDGVKAIIRLPEKEAVNAENQYDIQYQLNKDYFHPFSKMSKLVDLLADEKSNEVLTKHPKLFGLAHVPDFCTFTPLELTYIGFLFVDKDDVERLDKELKEIIYAGTI